MPPVLLGVRDGKAAVQWDEMIFDAVVVEAAVLLPVPGRMFP